MTSLRRWDRLRDLIGRTTFAGQYSFFSDEPAAETTVAKPSKQEREWLEEVVDATLPLF